MSSSFGRKEHSFPLTGSSRGKSSPAPRSKKKQKRLEDICDSPASPTIQHSKAEISDAGALRRSSRARKVTFFPDFSIEPLYPKIGKSSVRAELVSAGARRERKNAGEEASDYHSVRFSRLAELHEKQSLAETDQKSEEDAREIMDSPDVDLNQRPSQKRKNKRRKSRTRFRIPQVVKDFEENRLSDCLPRDQDVSALPLLQNYENQYDTVLEEEKTMKTPEVTQSVVSGGEEANRDDEDLSHDLRKSAECGTVFHNQSFLEDDIQCGYEVASSTAECKFYSRRISSTRSGVSGDEPIPDGKNKAGLVEDFLKYCRNVLTTSSDEDLAEEKCETSMEIASPEEEGGEEEEEYEEEEEEEGEEEEGEEEEEEEGEKKVKLQWRKLHPKKKEEEDEDEEGKKKKTKKMMKKKDEASPEADTPRENRSREFNPLDGEAMEQTPCQLGNGGIEDHVGIQFGSCETTHSKSHSSRIREGRRCGLCGGGTDGKPAKKLILASAESDNEHYHRTSSSEEPAYDAWDGFGNESDWLGKLLGPIRDRQGVARIWVHQQCAVWSPEVYFAGLGCLKNIRAALSRGKALKCIRCGRPGATIGCRVDRCPKTYHLPCARAENSIFDHRKFLIGCSDHRHLFQPHGNHYLQRIKKLKMRKMKFDLKKLSHEASRKDLEAEERWLENCGEDEEFVKREGKRLHRDIQRIAPVFIGGNSSAHHTAAFKGWESVAGLRDVIQCLKEVVILPLLYPEVFASLALSPPRGVLLHGYPGTGKTHVVRALIGECARGDIRIAYFARKGADCLGKYVGDAERQLRLLFQVAEKSQPSIIFFDEIDGLAPCRSKRQDQTHNSVVATLLSLLDGLKSRGSVVVIGATNRPDSVDPALRRPGRFDREIYFPLPSVKDRSAILSLETKNWPKPLSGSLLSWVAKQTAGFAGADLQALCTQAVMIALKRNFPLPEVLLSAEKGCANRRKPPLPLFSVLETDWLSALASASPPCSKREAGMAANEVITAPLPTHLIPCLLLPLCYLLISFYLEERMWIPPRLLEVAKSVKDVIFSALEQMRKPVTSWKSHLPRLLQKQSIILDIEKLLSYMGLVGCTSTSVPLFDNGDDFQRLKFHGPCFSNSCISFGLQTPSGFRVLISGNPKSGQQHLAACLLDQFLGHVYIQKVNLSTLSQEGRGDIILGITQILSKCMNIGWCVVYMPRIDLWALDDAGIKDQGTESPKRADLGKTEYRSSPAWDSFIEHMDSMCGSSYLIVLATCEMAHDDIPARVRGFFTSVHVDGPNRATSEYSIPRFSVQLDQIVDWSIAIGSSVSRVSCDIIKEYIQLIFRRAHEYMKVVHETDFIKVGEGEEKANVASPAVGQSQHVDQSIAVSRSPSSRNMKGSSSLVIAALGYQILQYPQFAELCWATSKVKAGPCTDISGPWKIWPFNSCIIHSHESVEKAAPFSIPRNSRNRVISGLVRGLVAVGLLAYRGAYSSVKEVSSQVREVLELLVGLICEKIQRGKDSYRYSRILSQVAYMEDMVNTWAYTFLRSSGNIDENSSAPVPFDQCRNEIQVNNGEPTKNDVLETLNFDNSIEQAVSISSCDRYPNVQDAEVIDAEQSGDNVRVLTSSESLCVYDCCLDCLQSVNASVQGILTCCWKADGYPQTVDHIHDVVSLCSLNLVSAMRKTVLSLDDKELIPFECNLHSSEGSAAKKPGLKFHFRDGILLTFDPPEDAEFHCKFGKLCLRAVCETLTDLTKQAPGDSS